MTQRMVKGSNTALEAVGVRAVLRWTPGPGAPDVDASVLLLGPDGLVRSDADFVFYNEPRHPSGLARHLPKKRVPEGLTDTVEVDLAALDDTVDRVVIAASCDGGAFREVRDLCLHLYDSYDGAGAQHAAPLVSFDVVPDTGQETALICGEFYRRGGGWKFRALGQGYTTGLVGLATEFGIAVEDEEPDSARTPPPPVAAPVPVPVAEPEPAAPTAGAPTTAYSAGAPTTAYGYPLPDPFPGHVPAQPAYGYPQPAPAPTAHQQPQPAYGYPQPVAAGAVSSEESVAFALPLQGPQFQPVR